MVDYYYITGCDTGFGAHTARMLAKKQQNVIAGIYSEDSRAALEGDGQGYITAVRLDVTSEESVRAAAAIVESKLGADGRLVGLVNNAGLLLDVGFAETMPLGHHEKMMGVNYFGMVRVTLSVLPLLRRSEGRVVNTASIAGRAGLSCLAAYCASKHAVEGWSDSLRRELAPFGVSVHIVEPGVYSGTGLYQTFGEGFDKLFEKADHRVQQDYGEKYKNATRRDLLRFFGVFNNSNVLDVPHAYIHALTAPTPKFRYRVGTDSRVWVTLMGMLHESWQDFASYPMFDSPASAQPNAITRVQRRMGGWPLMRRIICLVVGYFLYKYIKRRFSNQ